MSRLGVFACLVVSGCFSPELRDCSVTCTGPDECTDGQVCSAGFCRAPDVTCEAVPEPAPAKVTLRVDVEGAGKVVVAGVGTCMSDEASQGNCSWRIAKGTRVQLDAIELGDKEFERWTTENCGSDAPSCSITVTSETLVGAKFK